MVYQLRQEGIGVSLSNILTAFSIGEFFKSCPATAMSFSELRDQQHQMLYTGHNAQNRLMGKSASKIHSRSCEPRWR